jgi:hypothetical protein
MSLTNPLPRGTRTSPLYAADGVNATFGVPFWFLDALDLVVDVYPPGLTKPTRYKNGVGYSATGAGQPGGGSVIMTAPPAAGSTLRVTGVRIANRVSSVYQGGAVNGGALDLDMDAVTATEQELRRDVDAALAYFEALSNQQSALDGPTRGAGLKALRANVTGGLNWLDVVMAFVPPSEADDINIEWRNPRWPLSSALWQFIFQTLDNGLPGGFTAAQLESLKNQAQALTPAPAEASTRITRRQALKALKANVTAGLNWLDKVLDAIPPAESDDANIDFYEIDWPAGGPMWLRVETYLNAALPGGFSLAQRIALEAQALAIV